MVLAQSRRRGRTRGRRQPARAQAEVHAVAVDHPTSGLGVEHAERRRGEARAAGGCRRPAGGCNAPARLADPTVARRGEPGVGLVEDRGSRRPRSTSEHLQGARLPRAVVDDDQLAALRGAPLGARHRLDQELARGRSRGSRSRGRPVVRPAASRRRRGGARSRGRGREIRLGVERGEQARAVRGGGRHQRDQRIGGIERAEEVADPAAPERPRPPPPSRASPRSRAAKRAGSRSSALALTSTERSGCRR